MNFARVSRLARRAGNQRTRLSPHWLAVYNSAGERLCAMRGRFTMRTLLDKLFRDRENVYAKRGARWIVVVIALALGGFLVLAPAGQDEQLNHVAGVILV